MNVNNVAIYSAKLVILSHSGKKPYQCTYCDYSFAATTNLKRHERRHTGTKPYQCTLKQAKTKFPLGRSF